MLAGHLPYWIPERVATHPDELLRARLENADAEKSLAEQDLISLADGLEGRSTNPVSLLVCVFYFCFYLQFCCCCCVLYF